LNKKAHLQEHDGLEKQCEQCTQQVLVLYIITLTYKKLVKVAIWTLQSPACFHYECDLQTTHNIKMMLYLSGKH